VVSTAGSISATAPLTGSGPWVMQMVGHSEGDQEPEGSYQRQPLAAASAGSKKWGILFF
jgi:hypothetical protein